MNELEKKAYAYATKRLQDPNFPVYNWETEITDAYAQGYKDAIDKACKWLEKNACNYEYSGGTCDSWFSASDLVESFRKYLEEQL